MVDHAHNKRTSFSKSALQRGRPIGVITRGTTNQNRLRKCDRFLRYNTDIQNLLRIDSPLVIDVGYGASYTTTCEWARWLRRINPNISVIGLEIDPDRIQEPREGVSFELGGFELAGYHPQLVRAFNVLRQYDVDQVHDAWSLVCSRLAPGGIFIEGTCDEIGRRMSWISLNAEGPQTLSLAWAPAHTEHPSQLAERLPKALIHLNTPGHAIYDLLSLADKAWDHCAPWATYGPRMRWIKALDILQAEGIPLIRGRKNPRDSLLTVPWDFIAPHY